MTVYVALVRAANVGGTGKLPMAELKQMCVDLGYQNAATYITSGNVVFKTTESAGKVKKSLEAAILDFMRRDSEGKKGLSVFVKTLAEMTEVLENNPFVGKPGNQVYAVFLDGVVGRDVLVGVRQQVDEEIVPGKGVLYVYYGEGMGKSKLVIPAAKSGTARNMNTVAKLVEMATGLVKYL